MDGYSKLIEEAQAIDSNFAEAAYMVIAVHTFAVTKETVAAAKNSKTFSGSSLEVKIDHCQAWANANGTTAIVDSNFTR